jgi:methionyl-tRNA formyltransferase
MKKEEMRIVFMGTPDFAVASFEALIEAGFNVVAVVTTPDKPAGRGRKIQESAVKKAAVKHNIPVLQPFKFRDEQFLDDLKSYQADLQIVVAFKMLPKIVWDMPRMGTFNLHASLLPQYRGAAPINWAIINGEAETGITTFFLNEKIDTGALLKQKKVLIEDDETAGTLHDKLMDTGATLVVETTNELAAGSITPIPQKQVPEDEIKPAPKLFPEDCKINWDQDINDVYNHIRGLSPYPAAWSNIKWPSDDKLKKCKVYAVEKTLSASTETCGTLLSDGKTYLHCCTRRGVLALKELQVEGKKRMKVEDFLRGAPDLHLHKFL